MAKKPASAAFGGGVHHCTIDTPISHLNEIRIESDADLIVLTPDTGAVVTFVTHAPSAPLSSSLECSLVSENL